MRIKNITGSRKLFDKNGNQVYPGQVGEMTEKSGKLYVAQGFGECLDPPPAKKVTKKKVTKKKVTKKKAVAKPVDPLEDALS